MATSNNFLLPDLLEIDLQKSDIAIAKENWEYEIRRPIPANDPGGAAQIAKDKDVKQAKTDYDSLTRKMRTLIKDATARYDTWAQAQTATSSTATTATAAIHFQHSTFNPLYCILFNGISLTGAII